MSLKTIPALLVQETSINSSDASVSNPGLGAEALEIKKTTDQFAQKEANLAPATPRPSLVGRTAPLSPSVSEEELLLTPPSKRDKDKKEAHLIFGMGKAEKKAPFNPIGTFFNNELDFSDDNSPTPTLDSPATPAAADAFSPVQEERKTPQKPSSKFFGGGSTDSSATSSPLKTPNSFHTTPYGTPTPIKDAKEIIQDAELGANLIIRDKSTLERGLQFLTNLPSPTHSRQVESMRGMLRSKFKGPAVEGKSARKDLTLAFSKLAEATGNWVPLLLEPIGLLVLDRDHLTDFIKGSGWHICPIDHPEEGRITDRKINRATNIWCGSITTPGKESKFSSFIPQLMNEADYYSLINEAFANKEQCIARGENRALFMLQQEKNSFCIEAYFRESRIVTSAFPIFHYEKYDGKMKTFKVEIENQSNPITHDVYEVSYEDILQKAKALKKGDLPIEYDTATGQIIDLTLLLAGDPKFPVCPVSRGILVHIPKNLI